MTTDIVNVRKTAKMYCRLGWDIVPIRRGKKYPEIKQWQTLKITSEQVDEYFSNDITNIGILTGQDRFVIDLDMNPWGGLKWRGEKEYPWGDMPWDELSAKEQKQHKEHKCIYDYEQRYGNTNHYDNGTGSSLNIYQQWLNEYNNGEALNTPTSRTGSGGLQIFVKLPPGADLTQSSKSIHPAIDTRTAGGQVVVSPSIHPNGNKYRWIIKPDTPIIDCPEWLLEKLQMPNWRDEFRENQGIDSKIDTWWKDRKTGSDARELANSNYHISSGEGRKRALCSIAGYWSNRGLSGQDLVGKVLPNLDRMENDPSDPVDEKRVRAICRWVDGRNAGSVSKGKKSETTDALERVLGTVDRFPIDSLPQVIQTYVVNKSEQLGVPYDFLGGGVLCVFAGAIGTTYAIQLNNSWREPAILWYTVLADTGSRKTACFKAVWAIAAEKERKVQEHNRLLEKQFQKEKLLYEKAIAQFKDSDGSPPEPPEVPRKRILKVSDATYESLGHILSASSSGTSVFRAEILGWIESPSQYSKGKNGARTFYLEAYDGDSYTMTRVGSGETYIHRNHLNVWGFSQTKNFLRIVGNESNVDDGFAPRFLVSNPGPFPLASRDIANDEESLEKLRSIYSDLVDYEPGYRDKEKHDPITNYLQFDKEAQKAWGNFHNTYESITNKYFIGKNHQFVGWWNKFPGQLARLILVIHIIRWKSGETSNPEIDYDSVKMGLKLGKYFLAHAFKTVMSGNDKNGGLRNIAHYKSYRKIMGWVSNHKRPMDIRTMIQNRCFTTTAETKRILHSWIEDGLGIYINEEKKLFVPLPQEE